MRKPGFMLFLAVLLGILAAAGWVVGHPAGPSYGGKSLQGWLDAYGPGPGGYRPNPEADDALRHIGTNAVPYLLHLLHTTNSATTVSWPEKLAASVPASWNRWKAVQAVQAWAARYTKAHARPPASWGHWQAYLAFQALGPLGKPALPELVKMAQDPSGTRPSEAIRIWQDTKLVAALADSSSSYLAPGQPPYRGTYSVTILPPSGLGDGEIAAWSLAAIGADSVPALTAVLADPNPYLRWRAEVALGMMGGAAEPAVPSLIKFLNDPKTRWGIADCEAVEALGLIGRRPELALPPLIAALTNSASGMDYPAMGALGDFGAQATSAIPALLRFFPSSSPQLEKEAAAALAKISPDVTARVVVPLLLRDFQSTNPGVRGGAWTALCQLPDPKALPMAVLQQALDDADEGVRQEALWKLARMPDQQALAVSALIRALDDGPGGWFRLNVINFLGQMGPAAMAAVPELITRTNSTDVWVSHDALEALQKIDPGRWPTNRP